jgi:alpha-D-ribose 1-methylphosphonate 5-triphosphate synthase subunit PhnI
LEGNVFVPVFSTSIIVETDLIDTLVNMGFEDRQLNALILQQVNGDIDKAILILSQS